MNSKNENDYRSMANAYDMFLKQMGGKVSTLQENTCDKNCQNEKCLRARKQMRFNNKK